MTNPRMRMICAICRRPMFKAAALKGGLPVGRVCAASAGLVTPRKRATAAVEPERCQNTMPLFPA